MQARIDELTRTKLVVAIQIETMLDRIDQDRNMFCYWREKIFNNEPFDPDVHTKFCKYALETKEIIYALETALSYNSYLVSETKYVKSVYDDGALRGTFVNPTPAQYLATNAYLAYEKKKARIRGLFENARELAKVSFEKRYVYILSILWASIIAVAIALRITKTTGEIGHDQIKS